MTGVTASRIVALLASLAIAGCQDPYARDHAKPEREPAQSAAATPTDTDHSGPPASRSPQLDVHAPHSGSAPTTARRFASRWVNWDWTSAASQQRALAELAAAELARQLRANAESARIDATLARDKPGARGRIAVVQITTSGERGAGIVVTREQPLTDGRAELGGERYRVYAIRLVRVRRRWEVSAWTPQP